MKHFVGYEATCTLQRKLTKQEASEMRASAMQGEAMPGHRRIEQQLSLNDRLKIFSGELKARASRLQPGPEQDALLRMARIADTAARIEEWASSPGIQPPN